MTPDTGASAKAIILVVDDTPDNLSLLNSLLKDSYRVKVANSGEKALKIAHANEPPDLILLDIMMPGMDGYEVCRRLKQDAVTCDIPVIFVTAMNETENEAAGLALGAVDYLTKPISPPILLARVRNHLALRRQKTELEAFNRTLERRVADGVAHIERLDRLRRFFSPAVADLLLNGDADAPLRPRRRDITVVFLDLRGYTAFTEQHGADEVMRVLGEFHAAMGKLIMAHGGTLERFAGDGLMIFFNDPIEIPAPTQTAVNMAKEMQQAFGDLRTHWSTRGYTLEMGIGIASGIATIGGIGFEGRWDYGAIGSVTNLAARLCGDASGGQILVSDTVAHQLGETIPLRDTGEHALKGFPRPIRCFEVATS